MCVTISKQNWVKELAEANLRLGLPEIAYMRNAADSNEEEPHGKYDCGRMHARFSQTPTDCG